MFDGKQAIFICYMNVPKIIMVYYYILYCSLILRLNDTGLSMLVAKSGQARSGQARSSAHPNQQGLGCVLITIRFTPPGLCGIDSAGVSFLFL